MRVMNWNVEWMNHWFTADSEGAPRWQADAGDRPGRVAAVIQAMEPDVLTVQEGPSRHEEMALFVRAHLGDAYEVLGPSGRGAQKLYALVHRRGAVRDAERVIQGGPFSLEDEWEVDVSGDLVPEDYAFTREPLVVALTRADGTRVDVVNVHSKSKYVHEGERLWRNESTRQSFVNKAVRNRRRIATEMMRVRAYVDGLLVDPDAAQVIVAGDFNDGPGLDYFEQRYLSHNVVAIVAGSPFRPRRMLRHGFVDQMQRDENYTAVFDDFIDDIPQRPLLLDHLLLSPALYWGGQGSRGWIEHAAYEAQAGPSDHRPQVVELAD